MNARYHLSGTTLEGCNCPSPCPCSTACPTDRCDVAIGWHIDQGSAGAVDLSGLNVIGIYQTPDAPMGDFRARLSIDEKATPQQRHALVLQPASPLPSIAPGAAVPTCTGRPFWPVRLARHGRAPASRCSSLWVLWFP